MRSVFQTIQDSGVNVWHALAALAGVYVIGKVFRFCRADADLNLLSKRKLAKNAFEDKIVWITGASQGIGEVLAIQAASYGAYVILSSRSKEKLEVVRAKLEGKHAKQAVVLPFDITGSSAELEECAKHAVSAFGTTASGVDYLIHNAGASQRAAVEETNMESIENLYKLNVEGTIRMTLACLPLFLQQAQNGKPAKFVVLNSIAGQVPAPGQAVYAACKASIAAYFKTLHSELWTRGITATICHPGPVATGTGGQIRALYGPKGLISVQKPEGYQKGRMPVERVAYLVLKAAHNNVGSCWISTHPILLSAYLVQFWPKVGDWLINRVGPGRVKSYQEGGGGYSFAKFSKAK